MADRSATHHGAGGATWHVEYVAETTSTNDVLLGSADRRPDRSVLVAAHQTAGRGRLDRRWDAPPGQNLLVSLLFHEAPADATDLVRRAGLAVVDAITAVAPTAGEAALKWPNDVLLDGAKVAGVLAQRGGTTVVVGIGLNIGWCPPGAARLGANVEVDVDEMLVAVLDAYDSLPASRDALGERYRRALATLGQRVRVSSPAGDVTGTAVDVTDGGRLVVREDTGAERIIDAADVTHLRPEHRAD